MLEMLAYTFSLPDGQLYLNGVKSLNIGSLLVWQTTIDLELVAVHKIAPPARPRLLVRR